MSSRFAAVSAGLLSASLFLFGCGKPDPAKRYVRPEQVMDFGRLFGKNCSGCHGMDGQLGPAPPLNDTLFQAIVTDEQLRDVIQRGRAGTLMPAFGRANGGPLTDEQIHLLVQGIREQWERPDANLPKDLPAYQVSFDDPAGLAGANVAQGKRVFAEACAGCHGDSGSGGTAGAIADRSLGRLLSDQLLRRIVITGRADLDMPNYALCGEQSPLKRPLTDNQIRDVCAYVRSLQSMTADNSKVQASVSTP
ncbi:MAG: hypothetical protein KatS3mg105_5070 [Gemmatales bacterium]|nr:MAG: hypothetical protein KatS3mg105_5070 [Gemmatales bacterium]